MNIRRGLFRLWVIAAFIWVGAIIILVLVDGGGDISIVLSLALGPPIAALAIGRAAFWIARGFKESPPSDNNTTKQRDTDVSR